MTKIHKKRHFPIHYRINADSSKTTKKGARDSRAPEISFSSFLTSAPELPVTAISDILIKSDPGIADATDVFVMYFTVGGTPVMIITHSQP